MEALKAPDPLRLEGNIADNWNKWKQKFELYMTATGIEGKSQKVQSSTLLHVIGDEALEIYNTFEFTQQEDRLKLKVLLDKFEEHFTPHRNVTFERHVFNTRVQDPGENIDQFVTDLRTKARSCEYGDLCDSLIKDRIVVGIRDDQIRAKLLRTMDLDLPKAVSICRAAEASRTQMDKLQTPQAEYVVNEVKGERAKKSQTSFVTSRRQNMIQDCKYCGRDHQRRKCPAYGEKCKKCGKMNHFSSKCMSKTLSYATKKPIHMVEEHSDSDSEEMFIDMVKSNYGEDWNVDLIINDRKTRFKIDTGAQCNIIPESIHRQTGAQLGKSKAKLVTYGGQCLKPIGKCLLLTEYKKRFHHVEFQVINQSATPLLGLTTCVRLGLIKRISEVKTWPSQDIQEKYADVFDGLGCFEGEQHIKIRADAQPIIHAPRKVPVALRDKVKAELRRMENLDVIEKVTEPSNWVSSMVTVWKPEKQKIRICMDPKDLNAAIEREHYPMRTIEEVMARMAGAKVFSTLDAQCGYWQVKLDKESSALCTFNTPFGRYAYKRLPFGINTAGEIFQRLMTEMFEDMEGVEVIVDDILVWGENEEQHNQRLKRVLERVREKNIKLNSEKCTFTAQEVKYMGHILTAEGLKPDPEKVEAVRKMQKPTNKTELQIYLGMVTYLGKFIPQLSTVTAPLRILLEKTTEWSWMEEQDKSFEKLQKMVTEAPVLKYYDASKPVKLSTDASSCGIGAVLFQDECPIAYASKAFTDTQKKYAQIEKELADIMFGCDKFYQYLFGREFEVETDHKPLETIMKKPLAETPLRLQKMLLRLQKYNMTVKYKKRKGTLRG
uniref:ribonuclease H n=1 Tax=Cyprinus carpio TaxID=7962 RepID=A0A8C2B8P6_CYPCA